MEFGKLSTEELNAQKFNLPPDAPQTTSLLQRQKKSATQIYVGCAKWGRKDWIGTIYPEKTKEKDFLKLYAEQFNSIELNATFYRLPTVKQVTPWRKQVGDEFRFCPKVSQKITHIKRLKEADEFTSVFVKGITSFGETLGPVFLQLPPNYAPKNFDVLKSFIESFPTTIRMFVELRNAKWYESEISDQLFTMFENLNACAVLTDVVGRRDLLHMRLTTPEVFIRFVGNDLHPTDYKRVDDWVQRIKLWIDQGIQNVYFFMHQNEEINSPKLARYVIQELNKHCGTSLLEPQFISD